MDAPERPRYTIYTDGACKSNPGPGGWAAIILSDSSPMREELQISGHCASTTNNIMEMTAVIRALERLPQPARVVVYSDSAYIVNAFRERWFDQWIRNGWKTSGRKPVKNRALWEKLLDLCAVHTVQFVKVAGHTGDPYNERADRLANQAIP